MVLHVRSVSDEKGSALVASIVLSMLFIAIVFWFSSWSWNNTRTDVRQLAQQHARQLADSGVSATVSWLRKPSLLTDLPPGTSNQFSILESSGRVDVGGDRSVKERW